ncbi:MAG: hypothetical protein WDN49_21975 [Acetobacteraceae bacterium]
MKVSSGGSGTKDGACATTAGITRLTHPDSRKAKISSSRAV